MITFQNILEGKSLLKNPVGVEDVTEYDEVLSVLRTYCKEFCNAYKKNNDMKVLYRGFNSKKSFMVVDPSKYKRKGTSGKAQGIGLHNVLMSTLPQWKKYPSRLRCVIGTTSEWATKSFGNPYILIPFDGAKLGICPQMDLWQTQFYSECKDLCNKVYSKYFYIFKDKEQIDFKEFAKFLNEIKQPPVLLTQTPEQWGFKLMSYKSYLESHGISGEVWTDSKCLLIEARQFKTIKMLLSMGDFKKKVSEADELEATSLIYDELTNIRYNSYGKSWTTKQARAKIEKLIQFQYIKKQNPVLAQRICNRAIEWFL